MNPSSDREREIARQVDELSKQGDLLISAVAEIAARIPFLLSEEETRFLIRYIVWRRDNPNG